MTLVMAIFIPLFCNTHLFAKDPLVSFEYTPLSGDDCKLVRYDEEIGSSLQSCPGVADFKLLVIDEDARMSVNVIRPNKEEFPLNFWRIVSFNFSSLGKVAEWRTITKDNKIIPIALIIRVNAYENPVNPNELTSYLSVTKITEGESCVVGIIKPVKNAKKLARLTADSSRNKQCLGPLEHP